LWHLVVPLNRPIIVTLVLITVVTHWNSFMWPMVITSGPTWRVITVATASLQSQYNNNWTLVMAGTTLAMLPLVLLMIVFQKQITGSVGEAALRGARARPAPSACPIQPRPQKCRAPTDERSGIGRSETKLRHSPGEHVGSPAGWAAARTPA